MAVAQYDEASETLTLSLDEFSEMRHCSRGDVDHWSFPWKEVSNEMVDTGRWHIHYEKVIHRLDDDTFWLLRYSVGATEYQDDDDDDPSPDLERVYPIQVVRTEYHPREALVKGALGA